MIVLPDKELRPVAEQIIRGCEYKLGDRSDEHSDELQIYFVHDHAIEDVTRFIEERAAAVSLGPGSRCVEERIRLEKELASRFKE
jgi:hypothetical protein